MENFLFAANGVLPVFLIMAIGSFLRYKNVFKQEFYDQATKFVFLVATPALLFIDIAKVDFYKTFDVKFIIFSLATLIIYFIVLWILVPLFEKNRIKVGAIIHCSFRSNFAILGLPLLKNVLNASEAAKAEILLAFGVPVLNILAVLCLAYWSSDNKDHKNTIKKIITNPLIIGAVCGLLFSLFKIPLPEAVDKSLTFLGNTALGLGLLILGAAFNIKKFILTLKESILTSILKTVIAPIFGLIFAYAVGFKREELIIMLIFMGSSTAVNSYVMSKEINSDSELTSNVVVCTTGISIFTLFLGLYLIKSLGLY